MSPTYDIYVTKQESVQHKFLRYAAFKINLPTQFDDHNYTPIAKSSNLESIKSLHTFYDVFLIKKIKSNLINCADISIVFEARFIPYGLRAYKELKEDNSPRNIFRFSTVSRLKREWNAIVQKLNADGSLNMSSFKKTAKENIFVYN